MTAQQMLDWRKGMGFSQRRAAEELGVSLPTYQSMERGAAWGTGSAVLIDRRTALACAAIRAGLQPEAEASTVNA